MRIRRKVRRSTTRRPRIRYKLDTAFRLIANSGSLKFGCRVLGFEVWMLRFWVLKFGAHPRVLCEGGALTFALECVVTKIDSKLTERFAASRVEQAQARRQPQLMRCKLA